MVEETKTAGKHHHHHYHHKAKSLLNSPSIKLFVCFLGIFVAYLLFGIVQESM
jgi:hypothetical protein